MKLLAHTWLLVRLRHRKDEAGPGQRCNLRQGKLTRSIFNVKRTPNCGFGGEGCFVLVCFLQDHSFQSSLVLGRTVRIMWKVSWMKLFMMGKLGNRELEGLPEYARLLHGGC